MLALLLVVVEGAIRKWDSRFSEGIPRYLAYFSKDIVFGLLLLLPVQNVFSAANTEFGRWLWPGCLLFAVGGGLSCVYGFNAVGALLTVRAAVVLPVVAFLAVRRLGGVPVRHVAWLLAALTALNFGLAIVQNHLPGDHFLNKYATEMENVVELDSGVRATGTFSYISGLGVMSGVGIWAGLALLSLSRRPWEQVGGYVALAAGLGCGLASVSRGPVVIDLAMVVVWMVASRVGHRLIGRSVLAVVLVAGLAWGIGSVATFSRLGQDLLKRNEQAGDTIQERAFGQLAEAGEAIESEVQGRGLGTEQVGGNYARSGEMTFTTYESQLPRIVLETGVAGLVGFLVICGGALWALQRARREAAAREENAMLLATQLLLLPMFYSNIIFNHTTSAFVWMIFAVVLANVAPRAATTKQPSRKKFKSKSSPNAAVTQ